MRTQWNTGAKYTARGQRIVAEATPLPGRGYEVRFYDHDRGIVGKFTTKAAVDTPYVLEKMVMFRYLHNDYDMHCPMRGELRWEE